MKKVLVTGGAGFIGSAVCRYLVKEKDIAVLNLDKLTYAGVPESLAEIKDSPLYDFAKVDICDKSAVMDAFVDFQPDAVMHLAAESHVDRSIDAPTAFMETNIMGTYFMLECSRDYWQSLPECGSQVTPSSKPQTPNRDAFRFLYISTDEVYGSSGAEGVFKETTSYDPRSPYSASKAAGDHLVKAWFHTYGLPVVITNSSNNYGPYHFPEKLVPLVILNALDEKPLPVYGTGDNIRDWLHVEDHARALAIVVEQGAVGETYNVGGRNERSNLEVVEAICEILDELRPRQALSAERMAQSDSMPHAPCSLQPSYKELITFVKDRPGHDKRYAIDATKLERELGWQAKETFDSGIKNTVQWYLDNEWWWRPLRKSRYAGERLGTGQPIRG